MKLFLFLLLVLVFVPVVASQSTFTEESETHCNAGSCTLTLYGDVRFVLEGGAWVRVEDAQSLFGVYDVEYLQKDSSHDFRVVDYNYTSITLEAFITDNKESGKAIPIKVNGKQDRTITFLTTADRSIFTLQSDEPITTRNYTIGSTSTTIILNSPGTNLLDNGYILSNSPDTAAGFAQTTTSVQGQTTGDHRAYTKFNITQIPSGQVIDEAILGYRLTISNDVLNVTVFRVMDSNWTEAFTTWNNQPCGTDFNDVDNCDVSNTTSVYLDDSATGDYKNWTVTTLLQDSYDENHVNFSLVLKARTEGLAGSHNSLWSNTRFGSNYPFLNITYSVASVGERANATIVLPTDGTVFSAPAPRINTSINYTQNDSDGDSITFYIYFDGVFNGTVTTNSTMNFTEGSHNLTVNAYDGTGWGENDTVLFSFVCVSAWECTAWVNNGTMDYRSCTDSSMCVVPSNVQDTERPARDQFYIFFIMLGFGLALITVGLIFGEPLSIVVGGLLILIDAFMVMNGNIVLDSRFNDFGVGVVMIFISIYVFYKVATGDE